MIDEATRQQRLLESLWQASPAATPGVAVYRANADANAARALEHAFPSVAQMLGDEDFRRLAAEHRLACPPTGGDLGDWGDDLPGWIESHPGLAEWPWLADAARLDGAVHRAERAADASLDAAALTRLAEHDPAQLVLVPMPGLAIVRSRWPVVSIHAAHRAQGAEREAAFALLRAQIDPPQAQIAVVSRTGWRAQVTSTDDAGAKALEAMQRGASLATLLDEAGAGFDFGAWLAQAIASHWLKDVVAPSD